MTRMFAEVWRTWNPVVGCEHNCSYCYARELALGRLRHLPQYQGFKPNLVKKELLSSFRSGLIFPCDMGDLWGRWVPREWIEQVLAVVERSPDATFLMLTKNPLRYMEFARQFPQNIILGATIESNLPYPAITDAPDPGSRAWALACVPWDRKFISIEPVLEFDLNVLPQRIELVKPQFIYIGYDNWGNNLPEPALEKTKELIKALEQFTEVRIKTLREAWNYGKI